MNKLAEIYRAKHEIMRLSAESYSAIREGNTDRAALIGRKIQSIRRDILKKHDIIL